MGHVTTQFSAIQEHRTYAHRLLQRLNLIIAFVCAVLPPALLYGHLREYEEASIRTEATIEGRFLTEVVNRSPELWRYQTDKLEALLAQRSQFGNVEESRRILTIDGAVIAEHHSNLPLPRISARAPLLDAGTQVGMLEIKRSLRPAVIQSLIAGFGSTFLGALLYFLVGRLPLQALSKALNDLNDERDKALLTLRSIGDAVVTTNAKLQVEYLNPAAEQLTGWLKEDARGRPVTEVLTLLQEGTRDAMPNPAQECLARLAIVERSQPSILVQRGAAAEYHVEDSAAPIIDRAGNAIGTILVFHDVSDRIRAQQELHHAAFHDALTGLPNRDLFRTRLTKELEGTLHDQCMLAVMFMDLDHFKAVNDSLGHGAGDELLVLAAKRIRRCLRESDLVCRLGGDEFTVLLTHVKTAQAALTTANKIREALSRPFQLGEHQAVVSASIGIALSPEHGTTVEEILKNADTAMYQVKAGGRNNAQIYAPEMNAKASERLRMTYELHMALERDEYYIAYQPKLALASGRIVGVEALLRWQRVDLGARGPAEFVPHLEESGAIVQVGRWVLKSAVLQAKHWHDQERPLTVAVNVSAIQFAHTSLVADIASAIRECQLPPSLLQIELTESMLMHDVQHASRVINELRNLGVSLSLDDFGTGYSSLGYLRQFAFHELKIDRSFVHEIDTSPVAARIVKTVVELGQALGMTVAAEGVENAAQAQLLRKMGCDQLQGYWVAHPIHRT